MRKSALLVKCQNGCMNLYNSISTSLMLFDTMTENDFIGMGNELARHYYCSRTIFIGFNGQMSFLSDCWHQHSNMLVRLVEEFTNFARDLSSVHYAIHLKEKERKRKSEKIESLKWNVIEGHVMV